MHQCLNTATLSLAWVTSVSHLVSHHSKHLLLQKPLLMKWSLRRALHCVKVLTETNSML